MALIDLVMPKMGESIMEATILKWHKQPGDMIRQDETLLEIATDKVDSEIPSTTSGIVEEILFQVNAVVPIGSVIARVRQLVPEDGAGISPEGFEPPHPDGQAIATGESPEILSSQPTNGHPGHQAESSASSRFYSPLVLNIASNEGVSLAELEQISGSGNEGRVTKKDILQYVSDRKTGSRKWEAESPAIISPARKQADRPAYADPGGMVEILEMDRMRKLIADHMVRSKQTSPHVTSFSEADVTNLVLWREKVKNEFEKREGTRLTLTPLFIESIVRCIRKFPLINSSVDGDRILIKKNINIGMATAMPSGNLIVPVIRNADQFNLVGLARQVNTLADLARRSQLKPDDTQGGTFTMTNVGIFGSLMGTPIINQPQVAILATGAIKKRPVVIETSQGDAIAIRYMMYLSLSYDHRIVDGSVGAGFLSDLAMDLENFNSSRVS
jgi:2-oxoglutarate dehydrogenase E2 component (dihydrolipoamide succinyltransferase)